LPKIPMKRRSVPLPPAATGAAVFAGLFAALLLSHWSLLRLPYYWDEAGYYIPAAWDFFRTGSLIPFSTLTNAHPPLPSVYLALAWKLFGFSPLTTRVSTLAVAALGLTAVARLALQLTGSRVAAAWTLLLTALYPVWFAQSSLAHADIFAAACTLWGLVYALPINGKRPWAAALCFAAAALAKETSIAVPLALAAIAVVEGFLGCTPAQNESERCYASQRPYGARDSYAPHPRTALRLSWAIIPASLREAAQTVRRWMLRATAHRAGCRWCPTLAASLYFHNTDKEQFAGIPVLRLGWGSGRSPHSDNETADPSTLLAEKDASNSAQDDSIRSWRTDLPRALREAAWLASCVLPLAAWYLWHKYKTGFLFGNPEFLRYNAQANLELARILAALGHRLLHLTAHMNLFVPVLLALAALLLPIRAGGETIWVSHQLRKLCGMDGARKRPGPVESSAAEPCAGLAPVVVRRILFLLLANAFFFSVLGGALLTRYLLPMFPLVLLLAVNTLRQRTPYWQGLAALSAMAFLAGLFINPPYGFAPEDNLAYAHLVRLQQAGIAELNARYPSASVLSSWPLSDALTRPELGYLQQPYEVYPIDDFSAAQIARAAQEPEKYTAALVFSTKIDARSPLFTLGGKSRAMDERYFGLHQDLHPAGIARALGGTVVWEKQDQGQWIALIRFNRALEARLRSAECFSTIL